MGDKIIATYSRDSKRYHVYSIDESQDIAGSIYIPKGERIPKLLEIELRIKEPPALNVKNPEA